MRALATLILVSVWLSGCGFSLRGQSSLPQALRSPTYLFDASGSANQRDPFMAALRRDLIANGAQLVPSADSATSRLAITRRDFRRRTLASGRSGAVREYAFSYVIDFTLTSDQQTDSASVSASRNILSDEAQLLGAVAGEELAREQLAQNAARMTLQRLTSMNRQP